MAKDVSDKLSSTLFWWAAIKTNRSATQSHHGASVWHWRWYTKCAPRKIKNKKVACLMMAWRHGSMTPRCGYAFNAVWQFDKSRLIFRHSSESFTPPRAVNGQRKMATVRRLNRIRYADFVTPLFFTLWLLLFILFTCVPVLVDDTPWRFYLSVYVCVISSVFLVDQTCLLTLNYLPVSSSLDTFYTPVELAWTEQLGHSV